MCNGPDEQWSGLSASNRHLNLGKSTENGVSATYEAHPGVFRSVWSGQERKAFLQSFPRGGGLAPFIRTARRFKILREKVGYEKI